ncbi:hypothetical protein HDU85_005341 [Gaertneriomyces sp. JEL0708]|nr:hypothetical protein HDU85_005341 [Gaertneriomyces sp. JEL0708]
MPVMTAGPVAAMHNVHKDDKTAAATAATTLSTPTLPAIPPPTSLRIMPAFSEEMDALRWNTVLQLFQRSHQNQHIETFNTHTKHHQPTKMVNGLMVYYKMDANEFILQERFDLQGRLVDPIRDVGVSIDEKNWKEYLGMGAAYYKPYAEFFLRLLLKDASSNDAIKKTATDVLKAYLPTLLVGGFTGTSIYHPMIHLSNGILTGHAYIMAQGLAYFAYSSTPVVQELAPMPTDEQDQASIIEIMQDAREEDTFEQLSSHLKADFQSRMKRIYNSPPFLNPIIEIASQWHIGSNEKAIDDAAKELTSAVAVAATTTGHVFPHRQLDFLLNHVLIATPHLWTLMPYLEMKDQQALLRRFLITFLACYVCQGRPMSHPEQLAEAYITPSENDEDPFDNLSTSPPLSTSPTGSLVAPCTPSARHREWQRLCGAPIHLGDDLHAIEAAMACKAAEDRWGDHGGAWMRCAKVVRASESWDVQGVGWGVATSFALEEEE